MTGHVPPFARLDALENHEREIEGRERLEWTPHAFRRRFGPLVAMVRRPSDDLSAAVLTISHDGDVILEKSFETSVRATSDRVVLTSAIDSARAFAEEWIASIRPGVAP